MSHEVIEDCSTCKACPFAFTDYSEMIQGYGCLPEPFQLLKIKEDSGHNWACHDNEKVMCRGYAHHVTHYRKDLDLSQGNLVSYETWNTEGLEAAIKEADNK